MKKGIFCILLGLLMSFSEANAQETPGNSRFEVGANFSGNYSFRSLKQRDPSSHVTYLYEQLETYETYSVLPHGGLTFSWNFHKHLRLNTGLSFSIRGFETISIPVECPVGNEPVYNHTKNTYRSSHLEIPLTLDAMLFKSGRKHNFFVRAGGMLSLGQAMKEKAFYTYDGRAETSERDVKELNKTMFWLSTGLGYRCHLAENWAVQGMVNYQRALSPHTNSKAAVIETYLWNCGLALEINYLF